MLRVKSIVIIWAVLSITTLAAEVPAPPPASPATYLTSAQLTDRLRAAIAMHSDPALSPIGVTDQYVINEVHRSNADAPAVHPGWTELHLILEGSGILVTGGEIILLPENGGRVIVGGTSRKVSKGDAIIVPPNTPHWYKEIDGSLTAVEVRFIARAANIPVK